MWSRAPAGLHGAAPGGIALRSAAVLLEAAWILTSDTPIMALGSSRYSNDGGRLDGPVTVKKKIMVSLLMFWIGLAGGVVYGQKDKIIPRVDSNLFDRATFQADYDLVWQIVVNLLSEYQFQ